MFGESLPFENLLMKLAQEIFERIAKLPFLGDLSPFAFRRLQKFDEIDSSNQYNTTGVSIKIYS